MRKIILMTCVLVFSLTAFALAAQTEQSPPEQLKQLIADLQKNPDDFALREKIIKHVQTMKPAPEIPQEAKRPFIKGVTFVKEATSAADYDLAIKAFSEALLLAPWWPEAYYNLALAQEAAGKFDDGIRSIKLYLLTNPKDKEEAENRMYAMEAKKEKAQKETAAKKKEEEAKPDFSGVWKKVTLAWEYKFLISGREFTITAITESGNEPYIFGTGTVDGRNFEGSRPGTTTRWGAIMVPIRFKGSLSEDSKTIQISTKTAPELAGAEEYRESAQQNIKLFGQEWSTHTWTRVRK